MSDLLTELKKLNEGKLLGRISENEWLEEIAVLLLNYTPLQLAEALKNNGMDAGEIAECLKGIAVRYKAITVGGIILNDNIYPDTSKDDMISILSKVFPDEDINKAIGILYPVTFQAYANVIWNDTGVDIQNDEVATVEYTSGSWNINPSGSSCDANGISILAKSGYALSGYREGCLVGKVGQNETPFYIGIKNTLPQGEGRLYLTANDDVNGRYGLGYKDNFGSIEVKITRMLR